MELLENEKLENPPIVVQDISKDIEKQLVESNFDAQCSSFKSDRDSDSVEKFLKSSFFPLLHSENPLPQSFYVPAKQVFYTILGYLFNHQEFCQISSYF